MRVVLSLGLIGILLFPLAALTQVAQTAKQLEHSKLYQNYGDKTRKLTDPGHDGGVLGTGLLRLRSTLPARLDLFREMACKSDGVVIGKVIGQNSILTPDETFILTDATVSVSEVLKDNSAAHLFAQQEIVVTRPGGVLDWNGKKLSAKLTEFKDFSTGREYLLFLKFLPSTQDYQAFGDRSFELRNGMIFNLTRELLWHGQVIGGQDASPALVDARSTVLGPCN